MVETGHFPSWPLIEIRRACIFVKPNSLNRAGLAIGEDHSLADELSLGLIELAEDGERTYFPRWAWVALPEIMV